MSDLAARREARIRKILQNSSTRLKKITNISEDFAVETATSSKDETVPLKLQEQPCSVPKPTKKIDTNKSLKQIHEMNLRKKYYQIV
ncbi:hypothetical protein FQR65_LT01779 [Abscondita terminalis]|nr:hypothetical protein FQR65_LT01779 [Abscondita terminalis]